MRASLRLTQRMCDHIDKRQVVLLRQWVGQHRLQRVHTQCRSVEAQHTA